MADKNRYSILDFSKITGISTNTLRQWDSKGKLEAYRDITNDYRFYLSVHLQEVYVMYIQTQGKAPESLLTEMKNKNIDISTIHPECLTVRAYCTLTGRVYTEVIADIASGRINAVRDETNKWLINYTEYSKNMKKG